MLPRREDGRARGGRGQERAHPTIGPVGVTILRETPLDGMPAPPSAAEG
jgi:hypothetical protein